MDRFIGKVLDNRYEIIEVIGVGGMAIVYKAKCHRLNRFVALKVLKDEYAVDDDFRRRFYDESQAVAMLSHPNIVAVYDVSRTEGIEYIVMELIDGITLKEYMGRRGPLGWNEVTFFAMQIAKALEHAHERGIIHRDIKPQNIMLLRDGTVKVADFGIARHISKQETYNMGEAIGSVHYVSPEQAKGSYIDNRADIYSFGVVMYEMLTGRLPFEGDTPISIALQHINSIALPPTDHVANIPHTLEQITMKAMNPSLSKRYASATDILYDLDSFKNDPDVKVVIPVSNKADVDESAGMGHTRRLNNTGEVDAPRFQQKRESGVLTRQAARHPEKNHRGDSDTDWDDEDVIEVKGKKKRSSGGFPASLLFSIVAVALFFVGAIYFVGQVIDPFNKPDETKIEVPQLAGLDYDELMTQSRYSYIHEDFIIEIGREVNSDEVPAGQIITQSPVMGRKVTPGSVITVDISLGAKQANMEDFVGLDSSYASNKLKRIGMVVETVEEFSTDFGKGAVIRTIPSAGSELAPGENVVLYVSKGKELAMVTVPTITGLNLNDAILILGQYGLILGTVSDEERSNPDDVGKVVFQQIPAGSPVEEGTAIHINIGVAGEMTETTVPVDTTVPTSPPTTDGQVQVGSGTRYIPQAYAGGKEKTFSIPLIQAEGPITVVVTVNGYMEYTGTHYSSEGSITVTLIALTDEYSSLATVVVKQNGEETYNNAVAF